MKITAVRLLKVSGVMERPREYFEERLIRPCDIYPEHRAEGSHWLPTTPDGRYQIEQYFLRIDSDEGFNGLVGPIPTDQAYAIDTQLARLIIGHDPLATERIWDRLYRVSVHGRKGVVMQAISAIDCALWDLKGKWANAPVYRLLGGPVRDQIPAYASTLGNSLEPALVQQRAAELVAEGYQAMKWFPRFGPADGPQGVAQNVALMQTLREAAGPNVEIMLDAWMSWDVPYTVEMARQLESFRPAWFEEPVLPDKIEQYAEIRRRVPVAIAGGEHEYTRWGHKALLEAKAVDVLQADVVWAGGISEFMKIAALASTYDIPLIPHGHLAQVNIHVSAALPMPLCPWLEYLVNWQAYNQFFLKHPVKPVAGEVSLPTTPGIDIELDEAKIQRFEEVHF